MRMPRRRSRRPRSSPRRRLRPRDAERSTARGQTHWRRWDATTRRTPWPAALSHPAEDHMPPQGRRLTLSPIAFDVILALSQAPGGLRLAEISHVIGSPVSSVQTSLRVLISNGVVRREGADPPRYFLASDHPAGTALASTATVISDAAHAIALILRANPAVSWAAVD